jgi:hypothetical protein
LKDKIGMLVILLGLEPAPGKNKTINIVVFKNSKANLCKNLKNTICKKISIVSNFVKKGKLI